MTAPRLAPGVRLPVPNCGRCGGQMFDNRSDKIGPAAPDFRCKDAACVDAGGRRTALWERDLRRGAVKQLEPKNGASQNIRGGDAPKVLTRSEAAAAPRAAAARVSPPADECRDIARMHAKSLRWILEHELPLIKNLPGDVAGAVAQLTSHLFEACHKAPARRLTLNQENET